MEIITNEDKYYVLQQNEGDFKVLSIIDGNLPNVTERVLKSIHDDMDLMKIELIYVDPKPSINIDFKVKLTDEDGEEMFYNFTLVSVFKY